MDDLSPALRARVATEWTQAALAEHASIASFARFTLQLLALGAPRSLVEDSQKAGLDEVRHARASFRIASRYHNEPIGPGVLPMDDVSIETEPAEVLIATLVEGCVAETLSALECAEARDAARDARIREALAEIVEDETRHAQLAWRFASWLLQTHPDLLDVARRTLDEAMDTVRAAPGPPGNPDGAQLAAHGVLTDDRRHRIRLGAIDTVVRPAAAQLLAGARS